MEIKNLICIGCPLGCMLEVKLEGKEVLAVSGHTCDRGDKYAHKEVTNPMRVVTSTVPVIGGVNPVISVKTQEEIPKSMVFECMRELKGVSVVAPVRIGDIIKANIANTGISIIATKASLTSVNYD